MTFIDPKDFPGEKKIRILRNIVAGGAPRLAGDVITVPSYEAFELIARKLAEPYFESLKLVSNL